MQAIFSLAGKNSGGYEYMFVVQRAGGQEVAGKIRPRGSQGSIELNINSSLCFCKNSH